MSALAQWPWRPMLATNEELAAHIERLLEARGLLVDVASDNYDLGYWGRVAGLRRPDLYAYRRDMQRGWRDADAEK